MNKISKINIEITIEHDGTSSDDDLVFGLKELIESPNKGNCEPDDLGIINVQVDTASIATIG
jgi:hypothetical protein